MSTPSYEWPGAIQVKGGWPGAIQPQDSTPVVPTTGANIGIIGQINNPVSFGF